MSDLESRVNSLETSARINKANITVAQDESAKGDKALFVWITDLEKKIKKMEGQIKKLEACVAKLEKKKK